MKRACGVLLPISSLPSKYGIGCFSKEAYKWVDQLKDAGQSYWQILPLTPTSYGDSPYQSPSSFAGNPYFIDLEELIEEGLLTKKECDAINWGGNSSYVDYEALRIISRYGSEKYRTESGKAIAAAYLFQQGTPFLYQGQEIGMLNWRPESADMYEDVQTVYNYKHSALNKSPEERLKRLWRSSRDSARTPVQWSDEENAGFTTGTPWLPVNENYKEINVEREERDPDSLLNFYRKAIALTYH